MTSAALAITPEVLAHPCSGMITHPMTPPHPGTFRPRKQAGGLSRTRPGLSAYADQDLLQHVMQCDRVSHFGFHPTWQSSAPKHEPRRPYRANQSGAAPASSLVQPQRISPERQVALRAYEHKR